MRVVALILALLAVGAAAWFAATGFFGEADASAAPLVEELDTSQEPVVAAPVFAPLVDAAAATPESCWLGVMATWESTDQAAEGVARMQEVGLPVQAVASEVVPNWAANRTVAVVAVETAAQADAAVARAATAGFSGLTVDTTAEACSALDVVAAGATLGFIDVPVYDADHSAIEWIVNTGLVGPCDAAGDEFCPDAPVSEGELAQVLTAALASPPSGLDSASTAPASVGQLDAAVGGAGVDTTTLTRRTLASTLLGSYQTSGS